MRPASSRALEVNIREYRVDVCVDPRYNVIQEVMSGYEGLSGVIETFLKEVCHPRRNWQFIVNEARRFSLGYFYDLKVHPRGPEAAKLYLEISAEGIESAEDQGVVMDAYNNIYLLLQKCIAESGDELERFLHVIDHGLGLLLSLDDDRFRTVIAGYYQIKKLAVLFLEKSRDKGNFGVVNALALRYFRDTYDYWLSERDPRRWFEEETGISVGGKAALLFDPVSHDRIRQLLNSMHEIAEEEDESSAAMLERLLELPGFGDLTAVYRDLPLRLAESAEEEKLSHQYKLFALFQNMNIAGLSVIHEDTLREINRDISWLIEHEDKEHIKRLIEKTFAILGRSISRYPDAVLRCVLNVGRGIYNTDDSDLVDLFSENAIRLGFQTPDFQGISEDWQIKSNAAHIQNIRTWMELIALHPKWSKKLLSALIIHLSVSGVLIKDTDLFPRDITRFLNSNIEPVYNLVKQLMRLFPAYFNEIGAEGQLRDISTRIDEICSRKDLLVHFLRKQSHVESSNSIVSLIEETLEFWRTGSKEGLRSYLPPNIFDRIQENGPFVDGVRKVLTDVMEGNGLNSVTELSTLDEDAVSRMYRKGDADDLDIERVGLAISFYKLLKQKYCTSDYGIDDYIAQVQQSIPLKLGGLRDALSARDTFGKISTILDYLQELKDLILSPDKYEPREDIYRKRHIAADIPSMYGSYREPRFDALGLTFRLEYILNTLFENLISEFDLDFITHETFQRIYRCLALFHRALVIDGIPAPDFEQQVDLFKRSLRIKLFSFSQYLDIFRGLTRIVRGIVNNYFDRIHRQNLQEIISALPREKILARFMHNAGTDDELVNRVSEVFLRDTIALSPGLQSLDNFLTKISATIHEQAEKLPVEKHYLLLTYSPRNISTSIDEPASHLLDIVHLGNKALNIIKMKELGLPVPSGFVVTTEVFRCRSLVEGYPQAERNFRKRIEFEMVRLERHTGKDFGSPDNTLLVSVRSGSAISQPGMMDSYLNVGINEEIVSGMIRSTGREWFAWDSYRRFLQSYGMSFGIARDEFDEIIRDYKEKYGVPLKKDFSPERMREIAMSYRDHIESKGIDVPDDPEEQLFTSVKRVLNSWDSAKARTYRKIMGISDDWGTVQEMVFGNLSMSSGSGVLFTHSPKYSTEALRLWGDYTIGNQGEDVVSGLVVTYPVSIFQAELENRPREFALESMFPDIYRTLRDYAKKLIYEEKWAPQDIEFTFEGPRPEDLYLLQTRNMEMKESRVGPVFADAGEMASGLIGHGIGVSGGALSGRAVFSLDDISRFRREYPAQPLILVRNDTVPDDIREISAADGLLTARGGATSHAAIVANRLGKTCVVGCRDLVCMEQEGRFILKGVTVHAGDFISIDGSEGSVYKGRMKVLERGE
jgi:pyruvate,orthophosphate dikinase